MSYTRVESKNWFQRMGESLGGILVGVLLFLGSSAFLWWNEGDFVHTRDALFEAQKVTVELDPAKKEDAFDGSMVHAVGFADTDEELRDPVFGLGGRAVALKREVEFYQWVEERSTEKHQKLGGGEETVTTYTYVKKWVNKPVPSQQFSVPEAQSQYVNTVCMDLDDLRMYAKKVRFGAYFLPPFLVHAIGGAQPLTVQLAPKVRKALNQELVGRSDKPFAGFNSWSDWPMQAGSAVHEQGSTLYLGYTPHSPQVGDVRISFTLTPPAEVSLLAKVRADTFEAFQARNGKRISSLKMGAVSADEMYEGEQSENTVITWLFRLLGSVLVMIALSLLMKPLSVLVSVLPFLSSIADAGIALVSILLGLAWSCVIIAIAWLAYRPVLALTLLALACVFIFFCQMRGKSDARSTQAQ